MQEGDDGLMHPIAFESKKLSMAERAYLAQELELLAILHALRIWRCFVEGRHFVVRTDHHPLVYFRSRRKLPPPHLIHGPECLPADTSIEPDYLYAIKSIEESDWPKFYTFNESQWPSMYKDLLSKHQNKFVVRDNQVYRKVKIGTEVQEIRFALFAHRADLVHHFHASFGHPGQLTLTDIIKKYFMGELPRTINGNRWILAAVDYATNWTITCAIPDATGQAIADFIYNEIVMRFGCPAEILTDRGSNFMSKVLNFYLGRVKIHHKLTFSFHPRSNSKIERENFVLKQMIRKYVNGEIHRWDEFLVQATFASNIRKHRTTGLSLFFMIYGVEPKIPGDILPPKVTQEIDPIQDSEAMTILRKAELIRLTEARADAIERLRANAKKDKAIWDSVLKHQVFLVGDHILMRHEQKLSLEFNWKGPYIVLDRNLDYDTYKLKDLHGKEYGL
ncbi:hypothetical protein INT45_010598 [Circinella minor]|uniref:Integrase catalytic domain-containing protein n=1 Tax=Circinella minor TaxID=1195481 RepID=A0A8H7V7C1_9FUNG|nr:hypothetical protein INT45_010598 [Circinella minor]